MNIKRKIQRTSLHQTIQRCNRRVKKSRSVQPSLFISHFSIPWQYKIKASSRFRINIIQNADVFPSAKFQSNELEIFTNNNMYNIYENGVVEFIFDIYFFTTVARWQFIREFHTIVFPEAYPMFKKYNTFTYSTRTI